MALVEEASKLYDQGKDLWDAKKYKAAATALRQATQKIEQQIQEDTPTANHKELKDVLVEIRDWCAEAMHKAGDYRDAAACNRRNLEARLCSREYGPDHAGTLDNRRRLWENYSALGQYDLAIKESRSILKVVDGSQDRNNLAQSLFRRGDEKSMKEAVNINLQTLRRDEAKSGKSDFSLCQARHNLGVELCALKKFEEAKNLLWENITILDSSSRSDWSEDRPKLLRDSRETLARCAEFELSEHVRKTKALEEAERRKKDREAEALANLERERVEKQRREEQREEQLALARAQRKERLAIRRAQEKLEAEAREKKRLQEESDKETKRQEEQQARARRNERLAIRRAQEKLEAEEREKMRLQEESEKKLHQENELRAKERRENREKRNQERDERNRENREKDEKEQKDRERKDQERNNRERIEQEHKDREKEEQEQKDREKKEQEREILDRDKERRLSPKKPNDLKKPIMSSEHLKVVPERPQRSSSELSSNLTQVSPKSAEHRHKRTASVPSRTEPKSPKSPRSVKTSSLQDVGESLLPPLVDNGYTAAGRRRSMGDIHPHNSGDKAVQAEIKLAQARKPAKYPSPERESSTRSSMRESAWRSSSPSPKSDLGLVPSTKNESASSGDQGNNIKAANVIVTHQIMPGAWPGDPKDEMATYTIAQSGTQSVDIPQIMCSEVDVPKQPGRTHSNETLRVNADRPLAPEMTLTRTASLDHRQRSSSAGGRLFVATDPNSPGTRADLWFASLRDTAHRFLDTYKDYVFEGQRSPYKKVKIAVLDTGVANSSRTSPPKMIKVSKSRITWCKVAGNPLEPRDDEDGHGTQVASILLQVTPYAKLYVYRILSDRSQPIDRKKVAAAIEDAVFKHGVDIINMSFGWDHEQGEGHDELRAALRKCNDEDVLVFAATSNDDVASVSGMAYPARADSVIAVDAATSKGEWLSSNPTRDNEYKTHRFTALGEAIKPDADQPRMDGTSAATPVAAGTAALILEFARQPPLGYAPDIAKMLKRSDAMREVLAGAVSVKHTKNGEYRHLVPAKLFRCDSRSGDAGEWFSLLSRRHDVMELIGSILKPKYGHEILHPVHRRIQQHWAQGERR